MSEILVALVTLTFLEIILGVDNVIFISILSSKLRKEEQKRARRVGLIAAMGMRLALLFSLPGTALSDEQRALELLDPVARNPGGQLHGLAVLLAANLQERKRLDANTQGLQQKLDALRSLERSMIERKR